MAVINIPHCEPWIVSGPAFRAVLDPLMVALPDREDREEVQQALALKGLSFELMSEDQAARIASTLIWVVAELRVSLTSNPAANEWDLCLADRLATLEMLLHDLVE